MGGTPLLGPGERQTGCWGAVLLGDLVRELPPLVVNGDVAYFWWRARFLWRVEAEVVEGLVDGQLVGDVGNDLWGSPATATLQRLC